MKLLRQFGIIVLIALIGEILYVLLPFPIPASIYGIIILFLCLELRVISLDSVKEISHFLIEAMPIMFIPAAVGLMDSWQIMKTSLVPYAVITLVTTCVVMAVSGRVVQFGMGKKQNNGRVWHKEEPVKQKGPLCRIPTKKGRKRNGHE